MSVSVCMATFNGSNYIEKQLASIIIQLQDTDEIIIVDDASTDSTIEIIKSFNDNRIKSYINAVNHGHVYSFSLALSLSSNEIIFMSDQDDIWLPYRVNIMCSALNKSQAMVLSSNSEFLVDSKPSLVCLFEGVLESTSSSNISNIASIFLGHIRYYGCAMAIKREFLKIILPIPDYVESHDLWIAIAANLAKRNLHIDKNTLIRRVHLNNASILSRPFSKKIWSRVIFFLSLINIEYRLFRNKNSFK